MQGSKHRIPESEVPLRLTSGRASKLQITLAALACALILGMMIYGLNQPISEGSLTAAAPPASQTTGAAPSAAPQTGGNVADEGKAAPKDEAAPPEQQQQKPDATEDGSKR